MALKSVRQLAILAGLTVVLVVVLVYNRSPTSVGVGRTAPAGRGTTLAAGLPQTDAVRLPALGAARPDPDVGQRNPFRFRPAPRPEAPPLPGGAGGEVAGGSGPAGTMLPPLPTGPPPPPPITLKFIGVVEQATRLKLAVLSDGRNVFYGKEGDTVEGRYRIERIGAESIDMAYLDGRGRQTLRLSGS